MDTVDEAILEGRISVLAALRGGNRDVRSIRIDNDLASVDRGRIVREARAAGVSVELVDREEINRQASSSRHGGVIAVVGQRRFQDIDRLLPSDHAAFIAMIDGVEDPYNFGAGVRSLYAAGADGLVVRHRNWMTAAGTVTRASAGASELMPIAVSESAFAAADFFEERGLTVACSSDAGAISVFEADLTVPLFLVIGGEQRGITRSFLRRSTLRLCIPYARTAAPALGTVGATAILAFEVARQRSALARRPRTS